jgi:hypothetical protein
LSRTEQRQEVMVASTPSVPTGDAGGGAPNPPPGEGEALLLVSEFPPPPFYYRQAQTLTPPPIPAKALERGTKRAAAAAEKSRAESERLRLMGQEVGQDVLAGGPPAAAEEEGDVVAVFGEIVEDPLLFEPLDRCEDPRIGRDELKRLNNEVVSGFVKLVQDLVQRPMENKYVFFLFFNKESSFRAGSNILDLFSYFCFYKEN